MMNGFFHDVRYGFRILLKTPIVSVVAIVTLALGIGVTTAIFTFVDAGLCLGRLSDLPRRSGRQLHPRAESGTPTSA